MRIEMNDGSVSSGGELDNLDDVKSALKKFALSHSSEEIEFTIKGKAKIIRNIFDAVIK